MKTLVILHGWQSSKEKWKIVKEEIEKENIKVIVPDLPGFRSENELKKAWGLANYIQWVKGFVDEKAVEGFFLLGHSFGGRVAIKFAAKYPEKLRGLILVSAGGMESERTLKKLEKRILKRSSFAFKKLSFLPGYQFFRKLFYKFVVRKTDYLEAKGYLKGTFKKVIGENLTPFLRRIRTRTLIMWGDKDEVLPLSDGLLMKEGIKDSSLELLKGIGHSPHLENPKLLSKKIIDFVNQHPYS